MGEGGGGGGGYLDGQKRDGKVQSAKANRRCSFRSDNNVKSRLDFELFGIEIENGREKKRAALNDIVIYNI